VRRADVRRLFAVLLASVVAGCTATSDEPPPSGTVKFRGDWEMGNVHQFRPQWDGAQCDNTGVPSTSAAARGDLFAVRDIVASGAYSARVDLQAASTTSACEALHSRPLGTGHGFPPHEEWYALTFRLPRNYATAGNGLSVAQFNFQNIWGAPLSLKAQSPNDNTKEPNHVRLVGQAGECRPVGTPSPPGPGCEWSSGIGSNIGPWRIIPPERFALETWHDILIHVVWTTEPSKGLIEGFHRQRGGPWAQTVATFTGKPTVQWKPGQTLQPTGTTNDKIGAYRGSHPRALSVWYDNFCVATTRSAAQSCL
jgi:hypothetical protein